MSTMGILRAVKDGLRYRGQFRLLNWWKVQKRASTGEHQLQRQQQRGLGTRTSCITNADYAIQVDLLLRAYWELRNPRFV
ncbi:MAG: hypothetical protein IPM25_20230 [Chloracidobacterium sp.]|nr:hypothetical protein [Chloracidobacterium sp.]